MHLRHCHVLDLRNPATVPCEAELQPEEARLWIARKPLSPGEGLQGYNLIQGPSIYMRLEARPASPEPVAQLQQQHEHIQRFQGLRQRALAGQPWQAQAEQLQHDILQLLDWEEHHLYPSISAFLGSDRPARERGYEHQGIRRWLPQLTQALEQASDSRRWERFSLDLIHLMEHHLEYDEELYRLWPRVSRKAVER